MMRIPKNYFSNLNSQRYREYLKLLPDLRDEKTQAYTMLAFTLAALSFFGIFAINPTLSTIADLNKQLSDSKYVHDQLQKKITNLSLLQQKYTLMSADLPYLYDAIPKDAAAPTLLAQVQSLAKENGVKLTSLQTFEVQLSPGATVPAGGFSYVFSLEAAGTYDSLMKFATAVTNFNRIVTIEFFSIAKDEKTEGLVLTMRGRQYFAPETASVPTGL
jgi:Tfp pilus assembly protein PilO